MLNKHQILKNVLGRCITRIDIAAKYLIDNEFLADDYTFEYAITELLYDNCIIKRAVTNEKNTEIEKIFTDTKNLVEHFGEKLWPRLFDLHKSYFSVEELRRLHSQVDDSYDENNSQDDHLMSLIIDLFERKDKVNVFSEDGSIFAGHLKSFYKEEYGKVINSYKDLSKSINKELGLIISKSDVISNYTSGIQSSIRQMNLIPNNEENKWWYTMVNVNADNIEAALEKSLEKENVAELLIKAIPQEYKECRKCVFDTTILIKDIYPTAFNHLSLITKSPTAEYKTWNESLEKPAKSDHRILENVFSAVPGISNQIIQSLIDLVQVEDIDEQQKKNILATAYFIIGKSKEAIGLLAEDKK
jgi:hypothetical protein